MTQVVSNYMKLIVNLIILVVELKVYRFAGITIAVATHSPLSVRGSHSVKELAVLIMNDNRFVTAIERTLITFLNDFDI